MAHNKGNDGTLKIVTETDPNGSPGGGTVATVANLRNFNLNTEAGMIDTTNLGDAWDNSDPGRKRWTLDGEAHFDPSDAAQADILEGEYLEIEAIVNDSAGSPVKTYTGTVHVLTTGIPITLEDETVKLSFTSKGKGALGRA